MIDAVSPKAMLVIVSADIGDVAVVLNRFLQARMSGRLSMTQSKFRALKYVLHLDRYLFLGFAKICGPFVMNGRRLGGL